MKRNLRDQLQEYAREFPPLHVRQPRVSDDVTANMMKLRLTNARDNRIMDRCEETPLVDCLSSGNDNDDHRLQLHQHLIIIIIAVSSLTLGVGAMSANAIAMHINQLSI